MWSEYRTLWHPGSRQVTVGVASTAPLRIRPSAPGRNYSAQARRSPITPQSFGPDLARDSEIDREGLFTVRAAEGQSDAGFYPRLADEENLAPRIQCKCDLHFRKPEWCSCFLKHR